MPYKDLNQRRQCSARSAAKRRRRERALGISSYTPEKAAQDRAYRKANPDRLRAYFRDYARVRRATDLQFRLRLNLRRRITKLLSGRDTRAGSSVRDLGCSVAELKAYLESKFKPGMSWENYGLWHLDHIMPLSKFDLSVREEFLRACHFSNIQPLWAADNIRKGNKFKEQL